MKKLKLSYARRKSLYGYGFIALWFVGTVTWFLYPLANSLMYSFMDVTPEKGGMQGTWVGLDNYIYIFTGDANYNKYLVHTLIETLWKTPLILIFSLFIAVILNQKFKGRTFARAVFFLPVIIATGPVYQIINGDISSSNISNAGQFSTIFSTDIMDELFYFIGLYDIHENIRNMVETISNHIFSIIWNTGVQILMFLSALQNIPFSVRESAQIEGATAWEYFWKITLPYVSPMILTCLIFTVIDSFTSPDNAVMGRVLSMQKEWEYGYAAAMAWVYFAVVIAVVGLIILIMNHFIYYEAE